MITEAPPAHELIRIRFVDLPGYQEWASQYDDEYPEAIALFHGLGLDVHPDEVEGDYTELFEAALADLLENSDPAPAAAVAIAKKPTLWQRLGRFLHR